MPAKAAGSCVESPPAHTLCNASEATGDCQTWPEDRRSAEIPDEEPGIGGRDPHRTGESHFRAVDIGGELFSRVRRRRSLCHSGGPLPAAHDSPGVFHGPQSAGGRRGCRGHVAGRRSWHRAVRGTFFVQDLDASDLINRVRSRSAPRNLPIPPSRRSRQLTRPASVLTASGPIPSSVEQRRARTVSTPSPGTDPQIWRRRTACTSGPGRHIARRRGSLQRRRARRAENQRRQPAALAAPGTRTLAKDPRPRD